MTRQTPAKQLAGFIAKYSPNIGVQAKAALARMRALPPGAVELVYDNYNALAIGFAPSEKVSDAVFSIVLYPRWVSLFFLRGVGLHDPHKRLRGSGRVVRHIVLDGCKTLKDSVVRDLMAQAIEKAVVSIDPTQNSRIVIKSVPANKRPRRPK